MKEETVRKLPLRDGGNDDFGAGAGNVSGDFAGAFGNRRRNRAGAGDGARVAHGPALGARHFAVYFVAADWIGRATAILESRKCEFAGGNFLRDRNDSGRVHRWANCSADVYAGVEGMVRRISDVLSRTAVV